MPKPMSRRELVERAMALKETPRVPTYDLLRNDAAIEHYTGQKLPALADDEPTRRRLLELAGRTVNRVLDMTRDVGFGPVVEQETTDEFGFAWRHSPPLKTSWIVRRPFADEAGAAEFVKQWTARLEAQARQVRAEPEAVRRRHHEQFARVQAAIGDTVNLLAVQGVGLDELRHRLGIELFAYLQADEPGLISQALEAYTRHQLALCDAIADPTLSPAVLTYGDIACKQRLLHSPEFLRREFFPRLARLNAAWHERGFRCLFHSDGYLMDVMDDLVAAGIDGLNPIETVAGMDLKQVKARYGRRLFLTGGIDMSQLLSRGQPDEVRQVCRQAIRDASPGYFLGTTTEADNSCRLENLVAMWEVAAEAVP